MPSIKCEKLKQTYILFFKNFYNEEDSQGVIFKQS